MFRRGPFIFWLATISILALETPAPAGTSENLLGDSDFSNIVEHVQPRGYKIVAKNSEQAIEESAELLLTESSEGSLSIKLPEDRDIWIHSTAPTQLESDSCYLYSIDVQWSELQETGSGFTGIGPGFFIHVYAEESEDHLLAAIKPPTSSVGWVTVQVAFDTRTKPQFEGVRFIFVAKNIQGEIQLKNAKLLKIDREAMPSSPQFMLPNGEIVTGVSLAL